MQKNHLKTITGFLFAACLLFSCRTGDDYNKQYKKNIRKEQKKEMKKDERAKKDSIREQNR